MRNLPLTPALLLALTFGLGRQPCASHAEFNPKFGLEAKLETQLAEEEAAPSGDAPVPEGPAKKKFNSAVFGRYRAQFSKLCDALEQDGRRETLFQLAEINSEKDEQCVGCRALLRTVTGACKPRKQKKDRAVKSAKSHDSEGEPEEGASEVEDSESDDSSAKGEAAAVMKQGAAAAAPQQEPNSSALDIAAGIFGMLAEDLARSKYQLEALQAIDKLLFILRTEEGKTKGAQRYFVSLTEYMEAPLRRLRADLKSAHHEAAPSFEAHQQPASADDLFSR